MVNESKADELKRLEREREALCAPLIKREQEIREEMSVENEKNRRKIYADIADGKIFYGDVNTWSGFSDTIYLIKPISCEDWSMYNSCNSFKMTIRFLKNGDMKSILVEKDKERVSHFETHYKQLTQEKLEIIFNTLDESIKKVLSNFIL